MHSKQWTNNRQLRKTMKNIRQLINKTKWKNNGKLTTQVGKRENQLKQWTNNITLILKMKIY